MNAAESEPQARREIDAPAQAVEDVVSSGDKRIDMAWALAAVGAFFFLPTTAAVFAAPVYILGLPLIWVYLFGVWLFLICGAAALSFIRNSTADQERDAGVMERSEP